MDISIVIPMHNAERFICAAVDSVLAQVGFQMQIIAVDNNSSDRTANIVRERYRDSVTLIHEPAAGASYARNAGVRLATGTFLAFLDADDMWRPQKLAKQVAALEADPAATLSFTYAREFHGSELTDHQRSQTPCRPEPFPFLAPSSFVTKRETFLRVGEFPPVAFGEFIAWYGWAETLGMRRHVIEEVLVERRVHMSNSTRGANYFTGYTLATKWLLDRRRQSPRSSL